MHHINASFLWVPKGALDIPIPIHHFHTWFEYKILQGLNLLLVWIVGQSHVLKNHNSGCNQLVKARNPIFNYILKGMYRYYLRLLYFITSVIQKVFMHNKTPLNINFS